MKQDPLVTNIFRRLYKGKCFQEGLLGGTLTRGIIVLYPIELQWLRLSRTETPLFSVTSEGLFTHKLNEEEIDKCLVHSVFPNVSVTAKGINL